MRIATVTLRLATATGLLLAAPAFAQEAGDCDMFCRMRAYLTTDHMAADPAGEAQPSAPPKAHRTRAARAAPAPRKAPATTGFKPVETPTLAKAAPAAAAKPAPAVRVASRPTPPAAPVAAVPIRATAKAVAAIPAGRRAAKTVPAPAVVAEVKPADARATPPAATAAARPAQAAASTRTASLSSVIPGSAPAMPAGFH